MVDAFHVKEVLGTQATADGEQMLVGFKTVTGEEVALALDAEGVWDTLDCFLEATSLRPFVKGAKLQEGNPFSPDWFELGKITDSSDLALTLIRDKAHLSFRIPLAMAEKIGETLAAVLGKKFSPPSAPLAPSATN